MKLQTVLSDAMKAGNLSQREVSRRTGLSNTTISRILSGNQVDIATVKSIANWLEIPISSILDQRDSVLSAEERIQSLLTIYPELNDAFGRLIELAEQNKIGEKDMNKLIGYIEGWIESKRG